MRGDAVQLKARRSGTLQTFSVGDGYAVIWLRKETLGYVMTAWPLLRSMNVPYCVACSKVLSFCLCRGRNDGFTSTESTKKGA